MRKYFYSDGKNKFGPYSLEELRNENISRETLVWFQGMKDWKRADEIADLEEVFELIPPAIKVAVQPNYKVVEPAVGGNVPPKTWLVESILVTLFCCLPFGIVGIVNAAKVESRFYAGDMDLANKYSADAKRWTVLAFWFGIGIFVLYLLYFILVLAGVFAAAFSLNDLYDNNFI